MTNKKSARSPDFKPYKFHLLGPIKDEVYRHNPLKLETLWEEIQLVCAEILWDILVQSTESVMNHIQKYLDVAVHYS